MVISNLSPFVSLTSIGYSLSRSLPPFSTSISLSSVPPLRIILMFSFSSFFKASASSSVSSENFILSPG